MEMCGTKGAKVGDSMEYGNFARRKCERLLTYLQRTRREIETGGRDFADLRPTVGSFGVKTPAPVSATCIGLPRIYKSESPQKFKMTGKSRGAVFGASRRSQTKYRPGQVLTYTGRTDKKNPDGKNLNLANRKNPRSGVFIGF